MSLKNFTISFKSCDNKMLVFFKRMFFDCNAELLNVLNILRKSYFQLISYLIKSFVFPISAPQKELHIA